MASSRKLVGGHIPEDGDARERTLWRSRKLVPQEMVMSVATTHSGNK